MISQMKKIHLLVTAKGKSNALLAIRDAGVVHINDKPSAVSADASAQRKRLSDIKSAYVRVSEASKAKGKTICDADAGLRVIASLGYDGVDDAISDCVALDREQSLLRGELARLTDSEAALSIWGDFDASLLRKARDRGFPLVFALAEKAEEKALLERFDCIRLHSDSKKAALFAFIADSGDLSDMNGMKVISDVPQSLSDIRGGISGTRRRIAQIDSRFEALSPALGLMLERLKEEERKAQLLSVSDSFTSSGSLEYVTGFIPASEVEGFGKAMAGRGEIGYCISDVEEDDNPPTLLKNGRFSSMLAPVIDILGLFPGYRERDISFWFLSFFSIFFALIIGDVAYGLVFLCLGAFMAHKAHAVSNASGLLILLGACTVAWGVMTGTYFGSDLILSSVPFLRRLVIRPITNFPSLFGLDSAYAQNSVMRLCFTLGAIQLLLACVLNIAYKVKRRDLSAFADAGWYLIIQSLYFLVLYLLVKGRVESTIIEGHSSVIVGLIAIGFALIIAFGGQSPGTPFLRGLKSGLANVFTTFLDVVSAFGNVMSYIRLFAVGMASVAIAGSFNQIARNFYSGALFVVAAAVLAIGHALNLVMGLLSVVVHGVRLNVMEFSNQLGLEWSGYEYRPFK